MNKDSRLVNLTRIEKVETPHLADEEDLVEDLRGAVRPAQRVEQKMLEAMRTGSIFLSQLQRVNRPHSR